MDNLKEELLFRHTFLFEKTYFCDLLKFGKFSYENEMFQSQRMFKLYAIN